MQPLTKHTGLVATMDRANVDTDQIIPKQFLKRIERTGFGQFLFFDWRFHDDGSPNPQFELNQPRFQGASVLLALLSVSGIYLWWPVKRVTIDPAAHGRRFWFDVHNAVGVFAFVFVLVLALTGMVIGFDAWTTPLLYRVTGSQPSRGGLTVTPNAAARVLTPDEALAIARDELPGAAPVSVNVPAPTTPYRIALRYPEDRTPGGRSRLFINQYSGSVLQIESSRTTAAGTRLVILNRAIHTGDILGLPTRILMSLASLAAVAQLLTGLMMWGERRDATRRKAP